MKQASKFLLNYLYMFPFAFLFWFLAVLADLTPPYGKKKKKRVLHMKVQSHFTMKHNTTREGGLYHLGTCVA